MKQEIVLEGLLPKQKEIINDILNSTAKFHIINASRQSSKSFTLSKLALIISITNVKYKILSVSPSYEQSRIIFDNIINTKNSELFITKIKESKPFEIQFKSGTIILFRSAERADLIRGGSYDLVIADEFSFFKDDIFNKVIRPSTAAKPNSKIIIASTPRGIYNDFYNLVELGKQNDPNYKYYYMHYSDNSYYDLKEVEDAKARLPKNIFLQEYEAQFIDSGGEVFEKLDVVCNIESYNDFQIGNRYFGGIDWGRVDDKTVLTIIDKNKEVVFISEYSGEWTKMINDIANVLQKYKPIVYAESNGLGDPLISQLKKLYQNVNPFYTSNSSKKEVIEQLKMDIYVNTIKLPSQKLCSKLYKELSNFTFSITKTGLITYHHRNNENDDYVDSLAIANYAYNNHNKGFEIKQKSYSSFYGNS